MKKTFLLIFLFIIGIILYFIFTPSPIDPVPWTPPVNKGFTGSFEANEDLDKLQYLIKDECVGCEDLAFDSTGLFVYSGEVDGDILRFNLETKESKKVTNTGGRPLGMMFDDNELLIIADAHKGLISVDINSGEINVLTDSYQGERLNFVDDLDIDSSGVIYFSDASSKYGFDEVISDMMERRPHGALYSYDPSRKTTSLLLDDLYFANGVAISSDESFLFINETSNYSISKYWLKGPKKGTREFINDNLPGFPDNVTHGESGTFWLTLVAPRQQSLDDMMPNPTIRSLFMKLPKSMHPAATHYGSVVGLDKDGNVTHNFQSSNPKFVEITSVTEHKGKIYFGSLVDTGIAYMEL